ncbi:MAG: hypothetical protein VBE63_14575 [Lamprobacter sp.]|uniref:hypothetical protein n=1 Tax=Lamprobacter sp. TaxID=3100796 RepID=UPI002B25AE0A|nr:hypothetical protein [Lamprobacter sp.]MEA3641149.1 hypothetical protein [Lamprobacter sp.]
MTTLTRRFTKTRFVLALAGAVFLCCLSDIVQAADRNKQTVDAALEIGQIVAPAPVGQVFEVVDTLRDMSATAAGAATAYSVAGASGPAIMGKLAVVGGPVGTRAAVGSVRRATGGDRGEGGAAQDSGGDALAAAAVGGERAGDCLCQLAPKGDLGRSAHGFAVDGPGLRKAPQQIL